VCAVAGPTGVNHVIIISSLEGGMHSRVGVDRDEAATTFDFPHAVGKRDVPQLRARPEVLDVEVVDGG
jgi:hypothetical protein